MCKGFLHTENDGIHATFTNWRVITGPPCSGKTTLIRALEKRSFRVVHEVARAWIEAELAQGRTLSEVRSDLAAFEGRILRRKAHIEAQLPPDALIFLDRALPDSIAYFTAAGLDPGPARRLSRHRRYRRVYYCLPVGAPFQDGVRYESDTAVHDVGRLISLAYEGLGYRLLVLPACSVAERLAVIAGDLCATRPPHVPA